MMDMPEGVSPSLWLEFTKYVEKYREALNLDGSVINTLILWDCFLSGGLSAMHMIQDHHTRARTPEPEFCLTPEKCVGLSSCPLEYACND